MRINVPTSTYRLQLHKGFTFDDAAAIAPYLHRLGVSHVYSSPYLQAGPGSMHGYDVVDHGRVNNELGGAPAHVRFSQTLGENGLGQVLDIVPNHMAIGSENRLWWDVLENGAASQYASFFDIDWQPQEERLRDKVLVPVLGDRYGRVLAAGEIKLARAGSRFLVEAAGQQFPVAPNALPMILAKAAGYAQSDILNFIADSFGRLPVPAPTDRRSMLARHRDKTVLNTLLDRLCADEEPVCAAIDRAVAELNRDADALDELLNAGNYRLAYWKTADQQLGYRRFFDVNNLIGLRMERAHVFDDTHALVLDWLRRGVLDGVRVDHPDGLRDPLEYFRRLREAAPSAWIIGEKILAAGEFLRESWPIEGTSGYDFLNVVLGLLIDSDGLGKLTEIYARFSGASTDFPSIAHDKKLAVTQETLGSDVNRLTSLFVDICESHRDQRDATRADIRRAIRELAACFGIYRTYVIPQRAEITDEDRAVIARATQCAKDNRADIDAGLFDFLAAVLTLDQTGRLEAEFVLRFEQFTSPVMAKGVEDTAFYCFNRLTAMCEVGGDPDCTGTTPEGFHAYQAKMQATRPATMTTLSTHDTKRADDVRARLAVLTEMPEEFASAIERWAAANERYKTDALPDRNTEYFLYQTLIGAWPIDRERTQAYMQKAMREAKLETSWVANNTSYEDALNGFIAAILDDRSFVTELEDLVARINPAGRINSLTQTLLKSVCPGVPDLYQGGELWDHSLVDPDNRRPVDYTLRSKLLAELDHATPAEMLARMEEGLPKLHLIQQALLLRREERDWFGADAAYTPLLAQGPASAHVIACLRGDRVLAVGQLHVFEFNGAWGDTSLTIPPGRWVDRLTHQPVAAGRQAIAALLKDFPVALLVRGED